MNDTGGGVTAIHDVPGDITRIGFHWMLFFPFCHSKGASICSSHGVSRRSRGFFVPNLRICELFLHTENRGDHGFSLSRIFLCPEFSNFRIVSSHGESRRSRIFFVPNIFLVPNFRIVSFTRNVAEITDFFVPRLVLGPTDQREVICEFANFFFTRRIAEITDFFVPIFSLSRICELSNCFFTRIVAE